MNARIGLRRGAIGVGAGALALSGALVLTGAGPEEPTAAAAATVTAPPSAPPHADGWQGWLDGLPDELVQDLEALHELPADQRLAGVQDLLDKAAAGEYGDRVQRFAGRVATMWAIVPADLRADLEAVVALDDPAAIRAELERIRDGALAGGYGPQVQAVAERIADTLAAVPDQLRTDLENLRDTAPGERRQALEHIRDGALDGDYGAQVQGWATRLGDVLEGHRPGG